MKETDREKSIFPIKLNSFSIRFSFRVFFTIKVFPSCFLGKSDKIECRIVFEIGMLARTGKLGFWWGSRINLRYTDNNIWSLSDWLVHFFRGSLVQLASSGKTLVTYSTLFLLNFLKLLECCQNQAKTFGVHLNSFLSISSLLDSFAQCIISYKNGINCQKTNLQFLEIL
jgi:hypothetical protein